MAEKIYERWARRPSEAEDLRSEVLGAIGFWANELKNANIDIILHGTSSPHSFLNYTLSSAAIYCKIPQLTIYADFISKKINLMSFPGNKVYSFSEIKNLDRSVVEFCEDQFSSIKHPEYISRSLESNESAIYCYCVYVPKLAIKSYRKLKRSKKDNVYFMGQEFLTKDKKPISFGLDVLIRTVSDLMWVASAEKKYKQLAIAEESLAKAVSGSKKPTAVLFASYQPEATTSSDAGLYGNTKCLIGQLQSNGYEVFYKEHPMTFRRLPNNVTNKSRAYKSKNFYDDLCNAGVKLISTKASNEKVINMFHLTVTCNGTIGLQSALKGRKVVVLGRSWYGCPLGVYSSINQADTAFYQSQPSDRNLIVIVNYLRERWGGGIPNVAGVMTGEPVGSEQDVNQFFEGLIKCIQKVLSDKL